MNFDPWWKVDKVKLALHIIVFTILFSASTFCFHIHLINNAVRTVKGTYEPSLTLLVTVEKKSLSVLVMSADMHTNHYTEKTLRQQNAKLSSYKLPCCYPGKT